MYDLLPVRHEFEDLQLIHTQDQNKEWTAEEDAKLKEMKEGGKTWAEITAELGRHKGELTKRWKEIQNAGDGDVKKQDSKGDNKGGQDRQHHKKDKRADKKEEAPAKAPSKAPSKSGSRHSNGEARFTMGEWRTLQEDELFSFGELQCLSELLMLDERQRWLRIASMFADKTGRRVHQDDIKDKFEEMGRMG